MEESVNVVLEESFSHMTSKAQSKNMNCEMVVERLNERFVKWQDHFATIVIAKDNECRYALSQKGKELEELKTATKGRISTLTKSLHEAQTQYSDVKSQVGKLTESSNADHKAKELAETNLKQKKVFLSEKMKEIVDLKSKHAASLEANKQISDQLSELRTQKEVVENTIIHKNVKISNFGKEKEAMQDSIATLQKEKDNLQENLNQQIHETAQEKEAVQNRLVFAEQETTQLHAEVDKLRNACEIHIHSATSLNLIIDNLNQEKQDLVEKIENLDNCEGRNAVLSQRVKDLEHDENILVNTVKSLEEDMETTTAQMLSSDETIKMQNADIESWHREALETRSQLNQMLNKYSEVQETAHLKSIEELQSEVDRREQSLHEEVAAKSNEEEKVKEMSVATAVDAKTLVHDIQLIKELSEQIETLLDDRNRDEEVINRLQEDVTRKSSEYNELKQEIIPMQRELCNLREKQQAVAAAALKEKRLSEFSVCICRYSQTDEMVAICRTTQTVTENHVSVLPLTELLSELDANEDTSNSNLVLKPVQNRKRSFVEVERSCFDEIASPQKLANKKGRRGRPKKDKEENVDKIEEIIEKKEVVMVVVEEKEKEDEQARKKRRKVRLDVPEKPEEATEVKDKENFPQAITPKKFNKKKYERKRKPAALLPPGCTPVARRTRSRCQA
eukprot:Platyproteum_vivax@DN6916_c0_g1_i1.p1